MILKLKTKLKINLKKNLLFSFSYEILQYILPLITTPYLSRVLGSEGVGIYSFHYSIAYYFFMFAKLGLSNYGNRSIAEVSDSKESVSTAFCGIYLMQLFTCLLMVLAYLGYCIIVENANVYVWILLIYVASSILDINWLYFGLEQFQLTVTRNIIIKILSVVAIFIFVKDKDDVAVYTLILSFSPFLSNAILWLKLKKYISFRKVALNNVIKHIKPNLLLFIPIIAINVYKMMDKTMLGLISDYDNVGYYENSEKILSIPSSLISAIGTVMLPRITNLIANNKSEQEQAYFDKTLLFTAFFSSLMCFGVMGVSKEFVLWYLGDAFSYCSNILMFIMPSSLFLALANVIRTQIIIPYKKDKVYVWSVCIGALINLIFNILFISKYRAVGAGAATVLAELTVFIIQLISIWSMIKTKSMFIEIIPFYLFGILICYMMKTIKLPVAGVFLILVTKTMIGLIVYIILSGIYYILITKRRTVWRKS